MVQGFGILDFGELIKNFVCFDGFARRPLSDGFGISFSFVCMSCISLCGSSSFFTLINNYRNLDFITYKHVFKSCTDPQLIFFLATSSIEVGTVFFSSNIYQIKVKFWATKGSSLFHGENFLIRSGK